jgi:hypothetical protein
VRASTRCPAKTVSDQALLMRIILSRKGFDSSSGGCPSPIFPDGSMLALPIPAKGSSVRYRDLTWRGRNLGEMVTRLKGCAAKPDDEAHVDPDLMPELRPRPPGWRPAFGQLGGAQGHLRNEGVGAGDLFLFFGLFREVTDGGAFVRGAAARHVLWGWLEVGRALVVDEHRRQLAWAADHPHLRIVGEPSNVLYVATDKLSVPGADGLTGAGVFERFTPDLQLTASDATGPSRWRLPRWFHPEGRRSALSYHRNPTAWSREADAVRLRSVGRGQEFVLDADDYPEAVTWAVTAITAAGSHKESVSPAG